MRTLVVAISGCSFVRYRHFLRKIAAAIPARVHATALWLLRRRRLCRGYASSVTLLPRERPRNRVHPRNDTRERTMINITANVGRGHVPAVRKAADSIDEPICTQSVVPASVRTYSHPTKGFMTMIRRDCPTCHCKTALGSWQSRAKTAIFAKQFRGSPGVAFFVLHFPPFCGKFA